MAAIDWAAQTAGTVYDEPGCGGVPNPNLDLGQFASCPRGFLAVAIDPRTMRDSTFAQGPVNPRFSNASTVLLVGKEFWIGLFSGDRVGYGAVK